MTNKIEKLAEVFYSYQIFPPGKIIYKNISFFEQYNRFIIFVNNDLHRSFEGKTIELEKKKYLRRM